MIVVKPHAKCVSVVCFSPDGARLASGGYDGYLKVWDPTELHTGRPLWEADAEEVGDEPDFDDEFDDEDFFEFALDDHCVTHAQFTPDSKLLITSGWEMHVRVWDAREGKLKWGVTKPQGWGGVGTVTVSRDGKHIAFAGGQMGAAERVFITDVKKNAPVRSVSGHKNACGALASGPDGFVSGSADKTVRFWKWAGGSPYHTLALRGVVRGLMFDPEGSRLAASGGAVVMVWDLQPAARKGARRKPGKARHFRGHTDQVQSIDFAPDGVTLASAAHDGTVRVWDAASGKEVRAFAPGVGPLHHVAFAPDGLTLAFGSENGHLGLLDLGD